MVSGLEINGKELQNIRFAAERTGYSRDYITKLAREQKITASQIGRQWFVDLDSLTRYAALIASEQALRNQQLSEERKRERVVSGHESAVDKRKISKRPVVIPAQVIAVAVLVTGLGFGFFLHQMPILSSGFNMQVASTPLVDSFQGHVPTSVPEKLDGVSGVSFSQESVGLSSMEGASKGILLLPQDSAVTQNPASLFSDEVKVLTDEQGNTFVARVDKNGNVVEKIPFVVVPVTSNQTP